MPTSGPVFISAKSEDHAHARRVYDFLAARGVPAFFSPVSLPRDAASDYRAAIDRALEAAAHLVLVTSSYHYATSRWVEAEWGMFINEVRSGRKKGNLVTLTLGSLGIGDLPIALRSFEVMPLTDRSLDRLLAYVGSPASVGEPGGPGSRAASNASGDRSPTADSTSRILTALDRWDAARTDERLAAVGRVAALAPGFSAAGLSTFCAGGQTHEVGLFAHLATGLPFSLIPAGTFRMGSPSWDKDRHGAETAHDVRLTRPFLMCRTPVTQEAYSRVMGANPSRNRGFLFKKPRHPVENVFWDEAAGFCRKTALELPTEAQWEYACRAGTTGLYCSGNEPGALWAFAALSLQAGETCPVATKAPNAFGLFDMHGNVLEWCRDWSGAYEDGCAVDPEGRRSADDHRIARGAAAWDDARLRRSSRRAAAVSSDRSVLYGFRPCLTIDTA